MVNRNRWKIHQLEIKRNSLPWNKYSRCVVKDRFICIYVCICVYICCIENYGLTESGWKCRARPKLRSIRGGLQQRKVHPPWKINDLDRWGRSPPLVRELWIRMLFGGRFTDICFCRTWINRYRNHRNYRCIDIIRENWKNLSANSTR